MLTCPDRARARLIGYSEWIPYEVQMALIGNVASRGYQVTS
jgi:hypothetical protein